MTKYITSLTALIVAINIQCYSQTWKKITGITPVCFAQSSCEFVINNKAYIGSGTDFCSDWYQFDPASYSYTQIAQIPDTATEDPPGFSIGNYGYVLCDNNYLWQYNPSGNTWTRKGKFPGAKRQGYFWFVIGNTAYLGSGISNGIYYTDWWLYNQSSDTWQQIANCPQGNANGDGFSVNGKGYMAFGEYHPTKKNHFSNLIFEYDPTNDTWNKKMNAPDERFTPSIFTIYDVAFVTMGLIKDTLGNDSASTISYLYDPKFDTWTRIKDIPDNCILDEGVGFTINDKGYVGLGDVDFNTNTACNFGVGGYPFLFEYSPDPALTLTSISKRKEIKIWPNPAGDNISITGLDLGAKVEVYDMQGKKVYNTITDKSAFTLDLYGISVNDYLLFLTNTNGEKTTRKFIRK